MWQVFPNLLVLLLYGLFKALYVLQVALKDVHQTVD